MGIQTECQKIETTKSQTETFALQQHAKIMETLVNMGFSPNPEQCVDINYGRGQVHSEPSQQNALFDHDFYACQQEKHYV